MWQKISTLVLDEVSMKSARNLYNLDQWLRSLKNKPDRVFGGVHLIFSGDFFQLPPVHAFPLYDNGRPVDGDDALGRALWRSTLNAAVVLTENHRTKLDPAYGELLHVLREGTMDTATWRVALAALTDRWKFRTCKWCRVLDSTGGSRCTPHANRCSERCYHQQHSWPRR